MSAEEYLAWEARQEQRHEFDGGFVVAMAGGSPRHNRLCSALIYSLTSALRDRACHVFTSDQRLSLRFKRKYVYPDVSVVCGTAQFEEGTRDVLVNPSALVEVLSASTESNDRGDKWNGCRRLSSLKDYLLVSQSAVSIEHFQRQADGSWRYTVSGPGDRVTLANGAAVEVDGIYAGVFELPGDEIPET
jgi:Uma2 family endonuclease